MQRCIIEEKGFEIGDVVFIKVSSNTMEHDTIVAYEGYAIFSGFVEDIDICFDTGLGKLVVGLDYLERMDLS